MELIGKGAEAYVYMDGNRVVKVRKRKQYRIECIDGRLRKMRTKREGTALRKCREKGIECPEVFDVGENRIVMGYVEGIKLSEVHEKLDEYIELAGRLLGRLHAIDLCHGDYAPANLIVCGDGSLAVIDFGLCEFSTYHEKKASDIMVMNSSLKDGLLFSSFISGYRSAYKDADKVLKRFEKNLKRGRYKKR